MAGAGETAGRAGACPNKLTVRKNDMVMTASVFMIASNRMEFPKNTAFQQLGCNRL
jgi:hypothetical protein